MHQKIKIRRQTNIFSNLEFTQERKEFYIYVEKILLCGNYNVLITSQHILNLQLIKIKLKRSNAITINKGKSMFIN